jgi:glutamate N-acetyltransferase/amino-acid N-acetyltransferase
VIPAGFAANGLAAGIKTSGAADLALVATASRRPVAAAAVFTRNLAAAAPVVVSRHHLAASGGRCGAVIVNSGCANAATGAAGVVAAGQSAAITARELGLEPEEVLVCSTGPIGHELPLERITGAVPDLCTGLEGSDEALVRAARAIMTTDTREKLAERALEGSSASTVAGIAKGAAMLAPDMATMLAILLTDASVPPSLLQRALGQAVEATFNRLSIDGCTSTNDTVVALASGESGEAVGEPDLVRTLTEVCACLAHQMAADAEGGTRVVHVVVEGAATDADALRAARKVADASLVKCSWYGGDPNWGRVLSEICTAGVRVDPGRIELSYGPHVVFAEGSPTGYDQAAVRAYLAQAELEVRADLHVGSGSGEILSADLTHGYVDENMGLS